MIQNNTNEVVITIDSLHKQLQKSDDKINKLVAEIKEFQTNFTSSFSCPEIRRDWIPRDEVKHFLQFKDTQMSAITKKYKLTYSEIGKRRFFHTASIQKVLEIYKKN
jgi:hypothetical protein